jgi:hypothetical protein
MDASFAMQQSAVVMVGEHQPAEKFVSTEFV